MAPRAEDEQGDQAGHAGQGDRSTGNGAGAEARTRTSRGGVTGGTGSGRSGAQRNGSAGTGTKKRGSFGKKERTSADHQLISYVTPKGHSPDHLGDGSHEQQLRDAAGEAGVDLVIEHLKTQLRGSGARIEKMPEKNKGYDILVRAASGEPQRYIEVKSTGSQWGLRGVGLTEPQFSLAREERDRYWLYVVEHLYEPEARLWWIRDPAGRVGYFHYDHGWQAASDGRA